jgi:hypothetical protein
MTDATGEEITLQERPERVTTTNPSAAQTMWEIGAKEKVVGLTKYAAYLEGAETRTNVSGAEQIVSLERVVALEPDLVRGEHDAAVLGNCGSVAGARRRGRKVRKLGEQPRLQVEREYLGRSTAVRRQHHASAVVVETRLREVGVETARAGITRQPSGSHAGVRIVVGVFLCGPVAPGPRSLGRGIGHEDRTSNRDISLGPTVS